MSQVHIIPQIRVMLHPVTLHWRLTNQSCSSPCIVTLIRTATCRCQVFSLWPDQTGGRTTGIPHSERTEKSFAMANIQRTSDSIILFHKNYKLYSCYDGITIYRLYLPWLPESVNRWQLRPKRLNEPYSKTFYQQFIHSSKMASKGEEGNVKTLHNILNNNLQLERTESN